MSSQRKKKYTGGADYVRNPLQRHDLTYGIRIVEDFERAQELERQGYFPSAKEIFDQPDRVSAAQYLERMRLHGCFAEPRCSIIDLCCGSGNVTAKILDQVTTVERAKLTVRGIDINPDAIAKAKKEFAGVAGVEFQCADAMREGSDLEPADVVICHTAMHEFPEPHRLLQAATRLAVRLVILKDLVRPPVARFWEFALSRDYQGIMFQLFSESLKSSISPREMGALADREGFTYEDLLSVLPDVHRLYTPLTKEVSSPRGGANVRRRRS